MNFMCCFDWLRWSLSSGYWCFSVSFAYSVLLTSFSEVCHVLGLIFLHWHYQLKINEPPVIYCILYIYEYTQQYLVVRRNQWDISHQWCSQERRSLTLILLILIFIQGTYHHNDHSLLSVSITCHADHVCDTEARMSWLRQCHMAAQFRRPGHHEFVATSHGLG